MEHIKTKSGHEIVLHDSMETISPSRYHKYEKMSIIQSGIGCNVEDLLKRIGNARMMLRDAPDKAEIELENMAQTIMFLQQQFYPSLYGMAARVESIDGEKITDISDDGIAETAKRLGEILDMQEFVQSTEQTKKKIEQENKSYFSSGEENEMEMLSVSRLEAILDSLISGGTDKKRIRVIEKRMVDITDAINFSRWEVEYDKSFEKMCLRISENLHLKAKDLTQFEFLSAIEMMEEDSKRFKQK